MRVLLIGIVVIVAAAAATAQPLEIHCLNVGQGDATLVVSPSGRSLLIDGGFNGMGNAVVIPALRAAGVTSLTYMVASHYDADHIGGLDEVANGGFRPQVAFDRGTFHQVPTTASYQGYASALGSRRRAINPGDRIDLGAGVIVECVCVNGRVKGNGSVEIRNGPQFENAASIGLVLTYGDFALWTSGDLTGGGNNTTDVETTAARALVDVDVARLGHHGSNTSSNWAIFYAARPETTIISCGLNNPYGHPHMEIVDRMTRFPTVVAPYQTTGGTGRIGGIWANGSIRIRTDGNGYTVDGGQLTPTTYAVDERIAGPTVARNPGDLVVSEFMPNPARVSDALGEYVEVRNTTPRVIDMIGLTFRDEGVDAEFITQNVRVQPGGSVVIGRTGDPRTNGGFAPDWIPQSHFLANSADEIRIDDPWGNAIDVVRYTSGTFPFSSGVAAERVVATGPGTAANFRAATLAFGAGDRGTPGNPNAADPAFAAHLAFTAGLPVPGAAMSLRLSGPAGRIYAIVISGLRTTTPVGGATLGVGLDLLPLSFGLPGWIGTLSGGVRTVTAPIPAGAALIGQRFYLQAAVFDGAGLVEALSDVARLKIG